MAKTTRNSKTLPNHVSNPFLMSLRHNNRISNKRKNKISKKGSKIGLKRKHSKKKKLK